MIKRFMAIFFGGLFAANLWAVHIPDSLNYTVRLGYNIGGTAPVGMPATIRSMNKYKLEANFSLGLDAQKDFWGRWGLLSGLHLENKGMDVDATVKNYHMQMVQGGEVLEGMYTGRLVSKCDEWMLTVPVMLTYRASERVLLKFGPYISYVGTRVFKGHVYDGYLREGDPTGAKVVVGSTPDSWATYDFSSHMRSFQVGLDVGADVNLSQRIGVYADLEWGLNGIYKRSFKTIEQTLFPIFGTVGLTYKLR